MFYSQIQYSYIKFKIMKNRIIGTLAIIFLVTGFISAQVCPPTSGGIGYSRANNASVNTFGRTNMAIDRLAFSFSNIVNEGYFNGKLTQSEVWGLERDYRNVEREMRWAYADGILSFYERSTIDRYMRRLERNISREWNDDEVRLG